MHTKVVVANQAYIVGQGITAACNGCERQSGLACPVSADREHTSAVISKTGCMYL